MDPQDELRDLFGSESDDEVGQLGTGGENRDTAHGNGDVNNSEGTNEENGTSEKEYVEMRDLFGSEDEDEDAGPLFRGEEEKNAAIDHNHGGDIAVDHDVGGTIPGEGNEEEYGAEREETGPLYIDVDLYDALPPETMTVAKLPNSLAIDPEPFLHSTFEGCEFEGPTIRWRYSTVNGEQVMESNARLVTWSDGSQTLSVGGDVFQMKTIDVGRDNSYLYVRHPKLLQCEAKLNKKVAFNPIGIGKEDLKAVRKSRKMSSVQRAKVKQTATLVDPLREREEKEKAEEARIRDKEKLVEKQRQHMKRSIMQSSYIPPRREKYLSAAFLEEDDEYHGIHEEEDDVGDFIVSDDADEDIDDADIQDVEDVEEPEEDIERPALEDDDVAAERLNAIKTSASEGMEGGKSNNNKDQGYLHDSDGEENVEEQPRKKRAVVLESDSD